MGFREQVVVLGFLAAGTTSVLARGLTLGRLRVAWTDRSSDAPWHGIVRGTDNSLTIPESSAEVIGLAIWLLVASLALHLAN